jgi:hypothetical protein
VTTRVCETSLDLEDAIKLIRSRPLPLTLNILKGKHRSSQQNHLQRMWLNEAAEQLGEYTAEEYRAYCKLHFGVPIMRMESDEFMESYDRIIKPHSYEDKLEMMAVPLDFPVTRLMTTKQLTQYLDAMHDHFTMLGVQLTQPR